MSTGRKSRPAITAGPTAQTVAHNVRRVRTARGYSVYALSAALRSNGWPIDPSAVAKVERGERGVSVDDLVALAVVLDVNPSALLLPPIDGPGATVMITGGGEIPASEAWDWMDGRRRLDRPSADLSAAHLLFAVHSRPPLRRNRELSND